MELLTLTEREEEIIVLQSSRKKLTNKADGKCNLCGKYFKAGKNDHVSKCAVLTKLRNLPLSISFSK